MQQYHDLLRHVLNNGQESTIELELEQFHALATKCALT